MFFSYQYKLYPNKTQDPIMNAMLEVHRELYNAALAERREAWKKSKISISFFDQTNQIKDIRVLRPDLERFGFGVAKNTLRRLDKAFSKFFRRIKLQKTPGYPRFKSRNQFRSVSFIYGNGASLADNKLKLKGVGRIKIKLHRPLPEGATIKAVVIKRDVDDHWYATFQIELPDPQPAQHDGPPVGVDLGVTTLAALSTGELIQAPRHFRKAQGKLRRQQRRSARRKKFSKRWRKAQHQVAKTHRRIARQRKDFAHKVSRRLVDEFSLIAVEDLNIGGMAKGMFAKSITDAGWSELLHNITYKAESAGSVVVKVDRRYTSQLCSGCGCIVKKSLSVRVHRCECGVVLNRDHNAALNILQRALSIGPDGAVRRQRDPLGCA